MWQCPKCGREFKNLNQQHFCGEPDNSIDEYISLQPEEVRPILNELREALRSVLPEAQERSPGVCRPSGRSTISFTLLRLKIISVYTR